jgi:hypothetical protein
VKHSKLCRWAPSHCWKANSSAYMASTLRIVSFFGDAVLTCLASSLLPGLQVQTKDGGMTHSRYVNDLKPSSCRILRRTKLAIIFWETGLLKISELRQISNQRSYMPASISVVLDQCFSRGVQESCFCPWLFPWVDHSIPSSEEILRWRIATLLSGGGTGIKVKKRIDSHF